MSAFEEFSRPPRNEFRPLSNFRRCCSPLLRATAGLRLKKNKETKDCLLGDRFRVVEENLGCGRFAQVSRVEDLFIDGVFRAAKIFPKEFRRIGFQEASTLNYLNQGDPDGHQRIVRQHFLFEHMGSFCIILDLLGPPLSVQINGEKKLENGEKFTDWKWLQKIAVQLLTSLQFLSKCQTLHADLKPENVLLVDRANRNAKICVTDFGNAFLLQDASAYHEDFQLQSLGYRAPEVVFGLAFGTSIDCWSVGCLLCEIVLGRPLFAATTEESLVSQVDNLLGPFPEYFSRGRMSAKFSKHLGSLNQREKRQDPPVVTRLAEKLSTVTHRMFLEFISALLSVDPTLRLTPEDGLRHPFLRPLLPHMPDIESDRQLHLPTISESLDCLRSLAAADTARRRDAIKKEAPQIMTSSGRTQGDIVASKKKLQQPSFLSMCTANTFLSSSTASIKSNPSTAMKKREAHSETDSNRQPDFNPSGTIDFAETIKRKKLYHSNDK